MMLVVVVKVEVSPANHKSSHYYVGIGNYDVEICQGRSMTWSNNNQPKKKKKKKKKKNLKEEEKRKNACQLHVIVKIDHMELAGSTPSV